MVAAIPKGFHSVTPDLVVKGASKAIEFYKRALEQLKIIVIIVQMEIALYMQN
jgi:PhnB protein